MTLTELRLIAALAHIGETIPKRSQRNADGVINKGQE